MAVVALILSLAGGLFQIYVYLIGAEVMLFPPDQIVLTCYNYKQKENSGLENTCTPNSFLRLGARMAYVNKGQTGYSAVILKETVQFNLSGKEFVHQWQEFGPFDRQGKLLKFNYKSDAHPQSVDGGSAISRETFFAPHHIDCFQKGAQCKTNKNFIKFQNFEKLSAGCDQLKFAFASKTLGDGDKETICKIRWSPTLREKMKEKGWIAPSCLIES